MWKIQHIKFLLEHRGIEGCSSKNSFNEGHILAMAQAVSEFHLEKGIVNFLLEWILMPFTPAHKTTLEVCVQMELKLIMQKDSLTLQHQ